MEKHPNSPPVVYNRIGIRKSPSSILIGKKQKTTGGCDNPSHPVEFIRDYNVIRPGYEERLRTGDRLGAEALLPLERPYPLPEILARRIGMAMPRPPEQSPAPPSDFGKPGELMEAALREPDPVAALRAIAVKMSESGLGKKAISGIFLEHYAKLKEQERTREEDILGDVIDMVADTYPPNNLNLPG